MKTEKGNTGKKKNPKAVIITGVLFAAILISLFVFTREIKERDLFFPGKQPAVSDGPAGQGGSLYRKNIEMRLSGGQNIRGWMLQNSKSENFLIYYYGNGDSVYTSSGRMAVISEYFALNVVCFDYRGYAYSEGEPSVDNLLADSLEIYDHLKEKYFAENSRVFVYGQSLGTIPSLHTAVHRLVDGCILEAVFTDADRAIFEMGWNNIPFPLNLFIRLKPEKKLSERSPQPKDLVKQLKVPVLFLHCATDNFFPLYMAEEMIENSQSTDKTLTVAHNCRHYSLPIEPGSAAYEGMKLFFGKDGR